jgi:plastocyanin
MHDGAGGLANVVLYVEDCPVYGPARTDVVSLDQIRCRYVPRVLAVQADQPVNIRSSDNMPHNVHIDSRLNPALNIGMAGPDIRRVTFGKPEIIPVKCDIHPWMKAWICVFDAPSFAVSAADGSFAMPRLPAGRWTLVAWHEKFEEVRQTVDIPADGTAQVEITIRVGGPGPTP